MPLSVQDALIYTMVLASSSDAKVSDRELKMIEDIVVRLPVFEGFNVNALASTARDCIDLIKDSSGIDRMLDMIVKAIPARLHDTAYALAVEVATVDLHLEQEELRLLEMLREKLESNSLVFAAIEASARARLRKLNG